jgi:DNA-binding NarL/FixJ family response regulator
VLEDEMSTDQPIRVLSIDDHPLLSEGIATMINNESDMRLVGSASTGKEGILKHRELKPDVTLMDLRLPDLSGIDVMTAIRAEFPDARIILLTMFSRDAEIQRALRGGAQGFLLKSMPPEQMVETIRQVHGGKKHFPSEIVAGLAQHLSDENLSEREVEVLRHVAEGTRNRDIGARLFIAEETVKVHLKHIMRKLNAKDRTEAITIAARRGIMEL